MAQGRWSDDAAEQLIRRFEDGPAEGGGTLVIYDYVNRLTDRVEETRLKSMEAVRAYDVARETLERFLKAYPCNVAISCHGNSMRPLRKWFQHLTTKQEMALENPQDTDIEIDMDVMGKKRPTHQCVALGHKHVRTTNICEKHEERVIASFFPGRRVVRVLLPGKLRPRF